MKTIVIKNDVKTESCLKGKLRILHFDWNNAIFSRNRSIQMPCICECVGDKTDLIKKKKKITLYELKKKKIIILVYDELG